MEPARGPGAAGRFRFCRGIGPEVDPTSRSGTGAAVLVTGFLPVDFCEMSVNF